MSSPDLIATPGLATSNSYITVSGADDYHARRVHSDWCDYSESDRIVGLITATRLLDEHIEWTKGAVDATTFSGSQALQWPRSGAFNQWGIEIPTNLIPNEVEEATAELALLMLRSDRTEESDPKGLSEVGLGPLRIRMSDTDSVGRETRVIPRSVLSIIRHWGRLAFGSPNVKLRRV